MQTKIGKNSAMQRREENEMFLEQTVGKLPPAFLWPISGRKQTLTPIEGCIHLKVKKHIQFNLMSKLKKMRLQLFLILSTEFCPNFSKQVADKLKYRLWWMSWSFQLHQMTTMIMAQFRLSLMRSMVTMHYGIRADI